MRDFIYIALFAALVCAGTARSGFAVPSQEDHDHELAEESTEGETDTGEQDSLEKVFEKLKITDPEMKKLMQQIMRASETKSDFDMPTREEVEKLDAELRRKMEDMNLGPEELKSVRDSMAPLQKAIDDLLVYLPAMPPETRAKSPVNPLDAIIGAASLIPGLSAIPSIIKAGIDIGKSVGPADGSGGTKDSTGGDEKSFLDQMKDWQQTITEALEKMPQTPQEHVKPDDPELMGPPKPVWMGPEPLADTDTDTDTDTEEPPAKTDVPRPSVVNSGADDVAAAVRPGLTVPEHGATVADEMKDQPEAPAVGTTRGTSPFAPTDDIFASVPPKGDTLHPSGDAAGPVTSPTGHPGGSTPRVGRRTLEPSPVQITGGGQAPVTTTATAPAETAVTVLAPSAFSSPFGKSTTVSASIPKTGDAPNAAPIPVMDAVKAAGGEINGDMGSASANPVSTASGRAYTSLAIDPPYAPPAPASVFVTVGATAPVSMPSLYAPSSGSSSGGDDFRKRDLVAGYVDPRPGGTGAKIPAGGAVKAAELINIDEPAGPGALSELSLPTEKARPADDGKALILTASYRAPEGVLEDEELDPDPLKKKQRKTTGRGAKKGRGIASLSKPSRGKAGDLTKMLNEGRGVKRSSKRSVFRKSVTSTSLKGPALAKSEP